MKSSARRSPARGKIDADADSFSGRLTEALQGKVAAAVAREIDIATSTLQRYLSGSIPAADTALRLARALGVRVEWLIEGQGPKSADRSADESDQILLPRYDVFGFGEYGKGPVLEQVALPTWLIGSMKGGPTLWLTDMPSDALPDVAREGERILCRDPEAPLQDRRVYIFLFDGRPIVRRVFVRPDGLLLAGSSPTDEITLRPDELDRLMPAGRVLGPISFNPV